MNATARGSWSDYPVGVLRMLQERGIDPPAFDLTVGGSGNTTISGVVGTGITSVYKAGGGILKLSGANTYTGDTIVASGDRFVIKGALIARAESFGTVDDHAPDLRGVKHAA